MVRQQQVLFTLAPCFFNDSLPLRLARSERRWQHSRREFVEDCVFLPGGRNSHDSRKTRDLGIASDLVRKLVLRENNVGKQITLVLAKLGCDHAQFDATLAPAGMYMRSERTKRDFFSGR